MGAKAKSVTLANVAQAAGVSVATASKALNGKTVVNEQTRERVQQAASDLNFVPNPFAKALNSPLTGTIGVLTADLSNRFVLPVLLGIENTLGTESTSVILADARKDPIRERHQLSSLLAKRVDGIVILGHSDDARTSITPNTTVPVVYVFAPSTSPSDASYASDNFAGAQLAVDHLVARGRRRVAVITGDPSYNAAHQRLEGAVLAAASHDLQIVGGETLFGDWSEEWGRYGTEALLSSGVKFDAVFCANDQIARGVIDQLHERGIDVPRDVAVVGFDNWDLYTSHSRPPISTIDMNLEEIGRQAALGLTDAVAGSPLSGIIRVPPRLVPRASTAGASLAR